MLDLLKKYPILIIGLSNSCYYFFFKKKLRKSVLMDKDIWHTTLEVNFLGAGNLPHRFVLSPGIWGHCLGFDSLAIFNILIKRISGREKQRKV